MIEIKTVSDTDELIGILSLQKENLKRLISNEEAGQEGFVTAEYSLELLQQMHEESPSVIAKDGDKVVGYALVTMKAVMPHHDLLSDFFRVIQQLQYKGFQVKDTSYVVIGQLCVAKKYRGKGLVQQLYSFFKESLKHRFDFCLTDVAQTNPRSLKAHLKTGFTVIDTLTYGDVGWDIVLWDWRDDG